MAEMEQLTEELVKCAEGGDFGAMLRLVRENSKELSKKLSSGGVKDLLKKTTKDRLLLSFVDAVEFGARPLEESLVQLEKLVSLEPGMLVMSKSLEWGLGIVKRLDYFYKRITVDFRMKKGHQFSYAAAVDMLTAVGPNHVLAVQYSDPERFEKLLKEEQGELVKLAIKSFGPMSIQRLEDVFARCGFVKSAGWKAFWESARAKLRKDKLVQIPVKRTEPIVIKESEENYGDAWLAALGRETDPKIILSSVREYVAKGGFKNPTDEAKATVGDRLSFAATAARRVDDALYALLAVTIRSLGFEKPSAEEMRSYIWERKRFVSAASAIPARDVVELVKFLAVDDQSKAKICATIPDLTYSAVQEIVGIFSNDDAARKAIADFMRQPKAPATLTTLFTGSYERFKEKWPELPPFISLLTHAIALGEGRQNGEILRMQNIIRRLFCDKKWLEKAFGQLSADDKVLFFERFQASIAWDPSTHHTIVMRMVHIVPELSGHLVKIEKKKEYARITSPRSYALRKKEYLKLINEDMPENVRKIEEAKGYGDLSENAEYQYAKDEQRVLMQKQSVMQAELEAVKVDEFANVSVDEVAPGLTVKVQVPDGEKTYTILGEWDNDQAMGIISSKTRLAQNMLGKKVGDEFELPVSEGTVSFGKIEAIEPLGEDIKEWLKIPAGLEI